MADLCPACNGDDTRYCRACRGTGEDTDDDERDRLSNERADSERDEPRSDEA